MVRRAVPLAWCLVVTVATCRPALALDGSKSLGQYTHHVWRSENGLPQDSLTAVTQTPDGYLWLGTVSGLVRFDGVRFTHFPQDPAAPFGSNYVTGLVDDGEGGLWVGTGGGGIARFRAGRFARYTVKDGLPSDNVYGLERDREGRLWIATEAGLARMAEGRFEVFGERQGLGDTGSIAVRPASNGDVWVATSRGVARLRHGTFQTFSLPEGLGSNVVSSLFEDRRGRVWAGTAAGVSRFDGARFTTFNAGFSDAWIRSIHEDRDGNLWLGTRAGGLIRFREKDASALTTAHGLPSDFVRAIHEDREGNLWVATAAGLSRLKDGAVTTISTSEGLPGPFVWAVYEDAKGDVWVGMNGSGLARLRDGRVVATLGTRQGLSGGDVRTILEDRRGSLWVGTFGQGLNRIADGRVSVFTEKQGLPSNYVHALYEDTRGTIWVGTGAGLARIDPGRIVVAVTKRDGLPHDTARMIAEDGEGGLWIGTLGGLARLRNGRVEAFTTREGLSGNRIYSLFVDREGTSWFGTYGGLTRFRDGRFTAYTTREGLPDDVVYQVLEDDAGRLWASSNRGIFSVEKRQLEELAQGRRQTVDAESLGRDDGMKGAECNSGAPGGIRTRDGRLWFATTGGAVFLDPRRAAHGERPPPVLLEELRAAGRPMVLASPARVSPGERRLEFRFTAPSLTSPEKIGFRYRLEGFDADWGEVGDHRMASYTNLPPGKYRFLVTARQGRADWNAVPAALDLVLEPRFRETRTFWALCALGMLGALGAAYALRVRRLKARQRELVTLVDERTRSLKEVLELKDEVLSIVAHDFRSPLTVILGYSQALEMQLKDANSRRMLGAIETQSRRLASLAEDILTMSRMETGNFPLRKETVNLVDLLRSVIDSRVSSAGVDVVLKAPEDERMVVQADPEALVRVVHNLVDNAVKFSPPGSLVEVAVRRSDEGAQVSVTDRGPGISREEQGRLFEKFARLGRAQQGGVPGTGLGLYICRSIVEGHGGRIWVESEPGAGATFHFVTPVAV